MSDKQENKKTEGRGLDISVFQEQKTAQKKTTRSKKTAVKSKKKTEDKVKSRDIKSSEKKPEFETLKLGASPRKNDSSRIIIRDVARTIPTVEQALKPMPVEVAPLVAKSTPTTASKPISITMPMNRRRPAPAAHPTKLSAKEIKEREIRKALNSATRLPQTKKRSKKPFLKEFGMARIALATACAVTAIFAIVYFVNLTSKDMSMQVAAVQSGIEASYPSYIPRGYDMSDVTSSKGRITMNFKSDEGSYTITEEATTWDSDGLLDNYVKEHYGDEYTVLREQGLTIYMGGDWETWVNGGLVYKLTVSSGALTKKQMKTIATSFN